MRLRYILTAALLSAVPLFGASAEPQILGLLAQNDVVPLVCADGKCSAEFSSFCMEPDRASPGHLTKYFPTGDADLTLIAKTADGGEMSLPAGEIAKFTSVRGYALVRVSVSEAALAKLGATSVMLKVGERVALLPEARPDANRPHEPEEVALAKGPRRILGERIVDNGGVEADAARVMTRLLNALPEWDRVSSETRDGLWRQAIVEPGVKAPSAEAMDVVREAYDVCRSKDWEQTRYTLRQCLEGRHHKLIWSLNSTYWKSVGGS